MGLDVPAVPARAAVLAGVAGVAAAAAPLGVGLAAVLDAVGGEAEGEGVWPAGGGASTPSPGAPPARDGEARGAGGGDLGHDQGIRSIVAGQRCRSTQSPNTEMPMKEQPRRIISLMRQSGWVLHTMISRSSRPQRNRRGTSLERVGQARWRWRNASRARS